MMQKLALHYSQMLKGEFCLQELNFLFTFQVNCPGCFIYGIPAANALYSQFKQKVGFLGLSTAFEDFKFNTQDNTVRFLQSGEMTGETRKYFLKQGYFQYPLSVDIPVAMDQIVGEDFDYESIALQSVRPTPTIPTGLSLNKSSFK